MLDAMFTLLEQAATLEVERRMREIVKQEMTVFFLNRSLAFDVHIKVDFDCVCKA